MRHFYRDLLLCSTLLLTASLMGAARAQGEKPKADSSKVSAGPPEGARMPIEGSLKVGDPVPDIVVQDLDGKRTVRLTELKGKPVALFFGSCT